MIFYGLASRTQGRYALRILEKKHTPPDHLRSKYTWRARGCPSRICACTGYCQIMGWHNDQGQEYRTNKQKAMIKKRDRKARAAIRRAFRDFTPLYSQRNKK